MAQGPKHHRIKKPVLLVRRATCSRSHPMFKSYKPLCDKLKTNNNALAKALSKEKRENQYLFAQNVKLIAEMQDLGLACNKRDTVISTVLDNAKEMLKMVVSMTGYITNTISTCQKFVAAPSADLQLTNSIGRKDSFRCGSNKTPAKGVVKPMVSGHTITKPIINLNRVNMDRVNNAGGLSVIEEVRTPTRNQEANASLTPPSAPTEKRRWEAIRKCRMLERLTLTPPKENDENKRRLSRRSSRNSGRLSGKRAPLTLNSPPRHSIERRSIGRAQVIGSPRVELNDVSKLLQNSQSINIRMLNESKSDDADEQVVQDRVNTIPETPPSEHVRLTSNSKKDLSRNKENKATKRKRGALTTLYEPANKPTNNDDPLEGPSWLYNASDNTEMAPMDNSHQNKNDDSGETPEDECQQLNPIEKTNVPLDDYMEKADVSAIPEEPTTAIKLDTNECETKVENPVKFTGFITQRRGHFVEEAEEEDMDDFTLIYRHRPRNTNFDINDLKLPVLEQSTNKWPVLPEPEPEITATIQKITQTYTIPSLANVTMDESRRITQTTVNLPMLPYNDYDRDLSTSNEETHEETEQQDRWKRITDDNDNDFVECTPVADKSGRSYTKKSINDKDPSMAKVVLEKLSDSEIKNRTPSPDDSFCQNLKHVTSMVSARMENSSDSESNSSHGSLYTSSRLRRKRPISLQEPKLGRKLRRN